MKKITRYQLNQAINLVANRMDLGRPLKWVYIYGHHRGGTTYALQQYLKISKRGTGDWMMHEFAKAFVSAESRERQKLNMVNLKRAFRKNLLKNASIGGGQYYDFVLKQAVGSQDLPSAQCEIAFFTDLFKGPPHEIIFTFREPHGWWASAKKKFGHLDHDMIEYYQRAFEAYKINGGKAIEYGNDIVEHFGNHKIFNKIKIDSFKPKLIELKEEIEEIEELEVKYTNFKEYID
jgi:hypothetical protein